MVLPDDVLTVVALWLDRGAPRRPRPDGSAAAVVVAVLVAAVDEEAAGAASVAGAVAVGHDDRPARGVLLDALRGDRPRRQRPIAQRRNNTHHTDDRGTTFQPLVALIPLEFGLDPCLLDLFALALGLLAGPRLPDGRRARACRRRVLEPHAAAGRGLAGRRPSEGRDTDGLESRARVATGPATLCHRASRGLPPTDRFPAVDLPPAPLIAPRRRCGPVCPNVPAGPTSQAVCHSTWRVDLRHRAQCSRSRSE